MRTLILILCALVFSTLQATILHVAQDGSEFYSEIQTAIDASTNGDTVLVFPGTYEENITFNGHNITLGSLELTTHDPQFIHTTIIDGNHQGRCVNIVDGNGDVTLQGFTIIHGIGESSHNNVPTSGGGIVISEMDIVTIRNCQIKYNRADHAAGVAIEDTEHIILSGVSIHDNHSFSYGGGITFSYETDTIEFDGSNRCSIYNNFSNTPDIYCDNILSCDVILDTFTVAQPQGYFANYNSWRNSIPDESPFTFDILHGWIEPIDHDMYVSPTGNDSNDGLTPATPLKSIAVAIQRIAPVRFHRNTVHLASGTFSLDNDGYPYIISGKRYVNIAGAGMYDTIIEADNSYGALHLSLRNGDALLQDFCIQGLDTSKDNSSFGCGSDNVTLRNIAIRDNLSGRTPGFSCSSCGNVMFDNVHFLNNSTHDGTAALRIYESDVVISNCVFDGNYSRYLEGSAIPIMRCETSGDLIIRNSIFSNNVCGESSENPNQIVLIIEEGSVDDPPIVIENNLFYGNIQDDGATMSISTHDRILIMNGNTFVDNTAPHSIVRQQGYIEMTNSIFWNNIAEHQIHIDEYSTPYYSVLDYNDIQGGASSIHNCAGDEYLVWGENNCNIDPEFTVVFDNLYMLSVDSPLIDQGQPDPSFDRKPVDVIGNERIWDGDGDGNERMDIGCYEYQFMAPPENLSAEQEGENVHLIWDHACRSLNRWNIYRDSTLIDSTSPEYGNQYTDGVVPVGEHSYYITARYGNIETSPSNVATITVSTDETDILVPPFLVSAYPNPFNPETTIFYSIPQKGEIEIDVFNIKGQKVRTLINEQQEAGQHSVVWNGRDVANKACSSGIYFYRLKNGSYSKTRKMILLK